MNLTAPHIVAWKQAKIYIGTITTIVPATAIVTLRFVARRVSHTGLRWDDYIIVAALVVNWFMAALRWTQIIISTSAYDSGQWTADMLRIFYKIFLAVQISYFLNAALTKISLLLLYYRIFGVVKYYRWALWGSGFLVTSYSVICSFGTIFGCWPVAKFWIPELRGSCINKMEFARWNSVSNMILDVLVLCLPCPMVWRMQTTRRQKIILTGIFLLGSFVVIVSVLRITSLAHVEFREPNYFQVAPPMWSSIEQSLGIICACLPTLRPLVRRVDEKSMHSSSPNPKRGSGVSAVPVKSTLCPASVADEESVLGTPRPSIAEDRERKDPPSPLYRTGGQEADRHVPES